MVLQSNEHTAWVVEHLIKEKRDIELIGEFVTAPKCDVEAVNRVADEFGETAAGPRAHLLLRRLRPAGHLAGRLLPGRHAAADHGDVRRPRLGARAARRSCTGASRSSSESLAGARYDMLELGGGDASSTVISPKLFEKFVAPYDAKLIDPGARGRPAHRLPHLRRHDADPGADRGDGAGRHGDLHPARHGRRRGPGRGQAPHRRQGLHDRRVRPVPFLHRLHARADARRSPALLRGGRRGTAATSSARPTTSSTPTRS